MDEVNEEVEANQTTGGVVIVMVEVTAHKEAVPHKAQLRVQHHPHPLLGPIQALDTRTCHHPRAARSTGDEDPRRLSATAPWTAHGRTGSSQDKM